MSPPDVRAVLSELDSAIGMMTLVKYSRHAKVIREYKQAVRCSYQSAMGFIAQRSLPLYQETPVRARIELIKQWLEAEGLLKQ
jgi:hypothetical protein